ncbi:Uncharacterized protein HZ326_21342 [Fusarium oxysporum f. sp. albedinis]|nr:Uncharacterized protein HZ326_21342 [Fusarium oxysporum f. sp. albedinis]
MQVGRRAYHPLQCFNHWVETPPATGRADSSWGCEPSAQIDRSPEQRTPKAQNKDYFGALAVYIHFHKHNS